MEEAYISSDEVKSTDVICRRGAGGQSHPGNMEFRRVVFNNKDEYDKASSSEKEELSRQLWGSMSRDGVRFVREVSPGNWIVLEDAKCSRKIWAALRDFRGGGKGGRGLEPLPKPAASSKPKTTQPKAKKNKMHWMQVAATASPVKTKEFDESARAAIKSLLDNEALDVELRRNWGSNYEKKRERFEEQVMARYRAAAKNKGMSAEEFSIKLLPTLIREAGGPDCAITSSSSMKELL